MVRIRNEANTTTLFQFDDVEDLGTGTAEAIILNQQSLGERFQFDTDEKERFGYKSLIKRRTGKKNSSIPLKVLFFGTSRDDHLTTLINALTDNEFVYFDTEGLITRLDGVYAPNGGFYQKVNENEQTIDVQFNLIEKED